MKQQNTKSTKENWDKKPYRNPEVVAYGNLREITKNLALTMGNDNAGGGVPNKSF